MNKILEWEPEKSRLWGNARLANILHLRDDLAKLAEFLKTKADTAALANKADLAKVTELEQSLAETRLFLDSFKGEADVANQDFKQQLGQLDQWVRNEVRDFVSGSLQTMEGHVAATLQNSDRAQAAAEIAGGMRAECESTTQALRLKADELTAAWETTRQSLASVSTSAEQSASKAADVAQQAQQAASDCQAVAQRNQELHATLQTVQQEARERIATWLREGEAHANAAMQNGHLASAASELTATLKGECEELYQALRTKADQLTASWEEARQSLATASSAAEQQVAQSSESARSAQRHVEECQSSLHTIQDLRLALQADLEEFGQRASKLDEMLQQAGHQISTSGEHLEACQRLHSQIAETDSRLKSYKQTIEDQLRQAQQTRDESELTRKEIKDQLVTLQLNSASFWKRMKWVLFG